MRRQTPSILGAHWDDTSFSMVALHTQRPQIKVLAWDREPVAPGDIIDGVIQNPKAIQRHLQRFIHNHRLNVERMAFALPLQATRLTVLELSNEQRVHASEVIREQLEHCKPFGRARVMNDHVLYELEQGWRALNAMAPQPGSDIALDIACYCIGHLDRLSPMLWPILEGLKESLSSEERSLLLTLNEQAASLSVLQGHRLLFNQSLNLSLTSLLQGETSAQALATMVTPVLNYAQSMQNGALTLRVTSAGRYEDLRDVTLKIRHALKDVQVKTLGAVQWSKPLALTGEGLKHCPLPPLAAAWELARTDRLKPGLHLVSPYRLQEVRTTRQISLTSKIAVALILLIGLLTVPLQWKLQAVQAGYNSLTEQIDHSSPIATEIKKLNQALEETQKNIDSYQQIYQGLKQINWPALITDVVQRLPQNTRLAEIWSTPDGQLILTGQTLEEKRIHEFSQDLASSPHFDNAVVDEVSANPQQKAVMDFRLTINLHLIERIQL